MINLSLTQRKYQKSLKSKKYPKLAQNESAEVKQQDNVSDHSENLSISNMLQNAIMLETDVDKFEAVSSFVHKVMVNFLPDDIRDVGDLSLNKLVKTFGRDKDFKFWLESLKKIEEVSEKRIKNAQNLGELVDKQIVKKGLIAPLDGVFRSLLTDCVDTLEKRNEEP